MSDHPINLLFRARDQASKTIANVNRELSLFGRASKGAQTAARNLGRMGAVGLGVGAAAGILAIRSGLDSLAEREDVISATNNAIRATGQAAQISAAQVRAWSEALETATGAAVDDKAIQAGANTLIRFRVASKRALAAAVDLGAGMKTGPEQGAKTLGKALADPLKGMTALRRAGVVLSAEEEKRIKRLVKHNKLQQAQAALLSAVEKRYKGAAAASAGPYTRSLNMLEDASEDAKMALAEGFLPVIERFAGKLRSALDDPATMTAIRNIGSGLADAADNAMDFVTGLPWDKISSGLGKAADLAKGLVTAFTSLPPEAQATIIALGGLDRLSGGAVTGIVGELGKGLIKGVLGMTAGVVNINAAVVNNGKPGVPVGGKGGGKGAGKPGGVPVGTLGVLGFGAVLATTVAGDTPNDAAAQDIQLARVIEALRREIAAGKGNDFAPGGKETNAQQLARLLAQSMPKPTGGTHQQERERATSTSGQREKEWTPIRKATEDTAKKQGLGIAAIGKSERTTSTGLGMVASTTRIGASTTASAQSVAASRIVSAIESNRPIVNVNVYATGASVKYGANTGSAGYKHDYSGKPLPPP